MTEADNKLHAMKMEEISKMMINDSHSEKTKRIRG